MKIQILIILLIAIADLSSSNPSKCARIPDGTGSNKSPPDGRFRLRIINDPIRYIPGETYKSKHTVNRHHLGCSQLLTEFHTNRHD